jgi:GxxExxY protein
MEVNEISKEVIGAAIEVHNALGPGLLESAYKECLEAELIERGFSIKREVPMPIVYKHVQLDRGYRMDLVVNDCVALELKAKEALVDVDFAQLLTYLRLGDYRLGLLLNFNVNKIKDDIRRVINSKS